LPLPRNAQIWLPGYLKHRLRTAARREPKRVWVTIADHYEPLCGDADEATGAERVALWMREWPRIAGQFGDSLGRQPKYSFFYPQEEYRPQFLDSLANLTERRIGDVEVHIHHDGEGEQNFVDRMSFFTETLVKRHGLLRMRGGIPSFGFIHGNWALDNSRPDGRMCGLNNELDLLIKLGCYADFTLPSAPHATQVRTVNTIHWAQDDPALPKSHDRGIELQVGAEPPSNSLLMIPGPLGVRLGDRSGVRRWIPRLEAGEIAGYDLPTPSRIRLWVRVAPRVGDDVFIKLYTHGAQERNSGPLLAGGGLESLYRYLGNETRERGMELYYASAWEMSQAVEALRLGKSPVEGLLQTAGAVRS
jgi:hypothetical protein